ncbi:glycosyltransferase family 2 protein [Protaetiibacter larvae]|uniref:Glycosyltransferase family 2 protein n=1 Tax=Protaetiibacter larvae TaxID=2592654 RepID=A0A5C1Y5Y8_9MICO|nr:glycosyltransferase family A protein [Protaetiibacter larvae]QEO08655.1 glycosyltransferase family 2 protein [Protaetiibacter larvae]
MNASITPQVSVVIPLYQGEQHIRGALESVAAQDLAPWEVIVVDDGSRDNGPAIARSVVAPFPITVVPRTNGGQGAARNTGFERASGDFVALLDQDDRWYPDHLRRLLAALEPADDAVAWVLSDFDEVDAEGRVRQPAVVASRGEVFPKDLDAAISQSVFALPSSSLFRRDAILAVGGFDERLRGYEDDDLFVRLLMAGKRHRYLPVATTAYHVHGENTSTSTVFLTSREIYARKLFAGFADDPRRAEAVRRRFRATSYHDYFTALAQGRRTRAREVAASLRAIERGRRVPMGDRFLRALLRSTRLTTLVLRMSRRLPRWLSPHWPSGFALHT